jgi:prevent-host-death family protein
MEKSMGAYSVAQAKSKLSGLLQAAEAGEHVVITRRGVAIATLAPLNRPKPKVDWPRIKAFQKKSAKAPRRAKTDVTTLVRKMRDD